MMYLHRIMHDEVSETENIRKNLAIERMIVEGCEILLDTSQTFVRQGELPTHTHTHTHTQKSSWALCWKGPQIPDKKTFGFSFPSVLFFSANCHSCHLLLSSPPAPSSPLPTPRLFWAALFSLQAQRGALTQRIGHPNLASLRRAQCVQRPDQFFHFQV